MQLFCCVREVGRCGHEGAHACKGVPVTHPLWHCCSNLWDSACSQNSARPIQDMDQPIAPPLLLFRQLVTLTARPMGPVAGEHAHWPSGVPRTWIRATCSKA